MCLIFIVALHLFTLIHCEFYIEEKRSAKIGRKVHTLQVTVLLLLLLLLLLIILILVLLYYCSEHL